MAPAPALLLESGLCSPADSRRRADGAPGSAARLLVNSRYTSGMDQFDRIFEEFKVAGKDLARKISELIHEGNVRRIIIKDEKGHTFMESPLTVAAVGVIVAPILAAVGAIAALVSHFHVIVERTADTGSGDPGAKPQP